MRGFTLKDSDLSFVLDEMSKYCKSNDLNFVIVGSVGYKEGFKVVGEVDCDDLDCVIIYDEINQLHTCPFISDELYTTAVNALANDEIDLFATKLEYHNVKISLDLISVEYFKNLACLEFQQPEKILRKLSDAIENPTNEYLNFYAERYAYTKYVSNYQRYFIYHLPAYLYSNDSLFLGVLYNKFLFNPAFITITNEQVLTYHRQLLFNFVDYYKKLKVIDSKLEYSKAMRNWRYFSEGSKRFIHQLFK